VAQHPGLTVLQALERVPQGKLERQAVGLR
jgi:hypothetical protein